MTSPPRGAPAGLRLTPDYLAPDAAATLLGQIDAAPWSSALRRRVQHYGFAYDYRRRGAAAPVPLGPPPGWLSPLCARLVLEGTFAAPPDQVIVNEYLPGQGIAPHIDRTDLFGETIASLSLGGACVMRFEAVAGDGPGGLDLPLPPRSLLVMRGEARKAWRHGIAARKSDPISASGPASGPAAGPGGRIPRTRRVSITFRTLLSRTPSPAQSARR